MSRRRLPRSPAEHASTSHDLGVVMNDRLGEAVSGLRHRWPELSAGVPVWRSQKLVGGLALATTAGSAILYPRATFSLLLALLAFPFFCVVALRVLALWQTARPEGGPTPAALADGGPLPVYSVLVPLLDEAAVVPGLVQALGDLDYPVERLEIFFIVESRDRATRAAIRAAGLPDHMRLVVVPDGLPRTKPKALNYALAEARGDMVVVFDAEDVPEPDQLRRAAGAFDEARRHGNPRLGCLQARLNIYNSSESWLTRQFTLEYTALFDCILPTLQRHGLPVPLGGTSNHFPRRVLDEVGGWDPFNVTEDADLGIRLARKGWQVGVLASTTWEEAPPRFGIWKRQRTRWLKGWIQTYLVHMREPARLARELGFRGFLGLQILMGGMLLSALVHPWFYALVLSDLASGALFSAPESLFDQALWWLGAFNLVAGYVTGAAVGALAVARRGQRDLIRHALLMPACWLLISYAAYRALWQLGVAPYLWEKTDHAASARAAVSTGPGRR